MFIAHRNTKEVEVKNKEIVSAMLNDASPRMVKKALQFIEENINNTEDHKLRADAIKLYSKWFDAFIPKTTIIENRNDSRVIEDTRFLEFIDNINKNRLKEIECEDATVISEEVARKVSSK